MTEIKYDEDKILDVLKNIEEFVVSLDKISAVHHEFGEEAWKNEIIDYLRSKKMLQRLADIRTVLSDPFPDERGEDDLGYLEREMEKVDYWTFKEYLKKTGREL